MDDSLLRHINWFAIHAKPRRESFAEGSVRALGHEVFFPKIRIGQVVNGKEHLYSKPLFRGYFFARFNPEAALETVKCARGVLQVVSSGRFPIPVDETIIREMQHRVGKNGHISLYRQPLQPGDWVSIERGPLAGMMGRLEREMNDGKRVAILLESLCHARVLIEKYHVKAAV